MESPASDLGHTPLGEVIERFLAGTDLRASSKRGYATIARALARAFPDSRPSDFETADGVEALAGFMDERWPVPGTFNKAHSVFMTFFNWCIAEGMSAANPVTEIPRRYVERERREPFSAEERARVLATSSDVRDLVPLRLWMFGLPVGGIRQLRFADCDPENREVTVVHARGKARVTPMDDDAFWSEFAQLRSIRAANPSDYVWARVRTRDYNPDLHSGDLESLGEGGVLRGDPDTFLRESDTRTGWQKVEILRDKTRSARGAKEWKYACLIRAGIVEPGTTTGHRFSRARDTVGQEVFHNVGSMKAVTQRLGLKQAGSSGFNYTNRDSDLLDLAIRRVRRLLQQQVTWKGVRARPVKPRTRPECAPVATLLYYLLEEQALVDLSRVSLQVLRNVNDAQGVAEAAATLPRVVPRQELDALAEAEATGDHPLLHAHSLVAIWGGLETMAKDIPRVWRELHPSALPATRHKRVRSSAIDAFERDFDSIGLASAPTGQLARNLYELEQTRHLHVHRQGRADAAFISECHDLGYALGDPVLVTRDMWHDFMLTALLYAENVLTRLNRVVNVKIGPVAVAPPVLPIRYPHRVNQP